MDYGRSYSPVPPPCPSPQLTTQPLPTPPIYARRPSLTPSTSSREHLPPPKFKMKPGAAASHESLVFSLKDAIVAGSPSRHRFSEQAYLRNRNATTSDDSLALARRPLTAEVDRSFTGLTSSTSSSSFKRKYRRSDSIIRGSDASLPLPVGPPSRSLARKRTRSPSGRPTAPRSETPPPVPPLPPLPPKSDGRQSSFLTKKLPPIRIPELGLGLDEKLRSPLSPLLCTPFRVRRESQTKDREPEATSFLHMSSKRLSKRPPARASLVERVPPTSFVTVHPTHSLPDIKVVQRRSNPSLASRVFRLGTQQLVH